MRNQPCKIRTAILLSCLSLFTLGVGSLHADTLVLYTFDDESISPTTEAAGVNASDITTQGGSTNEPRIVGDTDNLTSFGGITTFGDTPPSIDDGTASNPIFGKSYSTSYDDDIYLQFTLQAENPGEFLSLNSLALDAAKGGGGSRSFKLVYSFDDFDTQLELGGADFGSSVDGWHFANFTFDLSGVAGMDATGFPSNPVSFRLLGNVNATNNQMGFDNITVDGSVIPEPGTFAMVLIGVALFWRIRRRVR